MWWSAEFEYESPIVMIKIKNRVTPCCAQRLAETEVYIGGKLFGKLPDKTESGKWYTISKEAEKETKKDEAEKETKKVEPKKEEPKKEQPKKETQKANQGVVFQ